MVGYIRFRPRASRRRSGPQVHFDLQVLANESLQIPVLPSPPEHFALDSPSPLEHRSSGDGGDSRVPRQSTPERRVRLDNRSATTRPRSTIDRVTSAIPAEGSSGTSLTTPRKRSTAVWGR